LTATEQRPGRSIELDQRRAYFSEAVQALVRRDKSKYGFNILGTLADFVKVASSDEVMVEIRASRGAAVCRRPVGRGCAWGDQLSER
jgi:hypothetical protein